MRVIVTAAAATLTLAACTKADWATPPSAAELVAADQAKCATYGYPVGQPEHEACFKAEIAMRTGVMANPSAGHTDIVAPPPPAEPIPAAPPVPTD
jgi:hypothetical protein